MSNYFTLYYVYAIIHIYKTYKEKVEVDLESTLGGPCFFKLQLPCVES